MKYQTRKINVLSSFCTWFRPCFTSFCPEKQREKASGSRPSFFCHRTSGYSSEKPLFNVHLVKQSRIPEEKPSVVLSSSVSVVLSRCTWMERGCKCSQTQVCVILVVCVNVNPQRRINHTQQDIEINNRITKELSNVDLSLCLGSLLVYYYLQLSLQFCSKASLQNQTLFCLAL